MEKRSRRRTRDLVTQAASQGLSENEIGCARISMMARSTNAPCKGRIQMRKTNTLQNSHLACNARPVHTVGSSENNSGRAPFRFTHKLGHHLMQWACLKRAITESQLISRSLVGAFFLAQASRLYGNSRREGLERAPPPLTPIGDPLAREDAPPMKPGPE
jgi:hypothetical protein